MIKVVLRSTDAPSGRKRTRLRAQSVVGRAPIILQERSRLSAFKKSLPRSRIARAASLLHLPDVRISREECSVCRSTLQVRLRCSDIAVRCVFCGSSAVSQSIVAVLRDRVPNLRQSDAYELSTAGPLLAFLRRSARSVVASEFVDGVPYGSIRDGVMCQNIQRLTFADNSFDLCTSTEVFEHVDDDIAGFQETLRVLRPAGHMIFTVPMSSNHATIERTATVGGQRVNTLPAEFHYDRMQTGGVFCYRNYGRDIVSRLEQVGFTDAEVVAPSVHLFGLARHVVVARKPQSKYVRTKS